MKIIIAPAAAGTGDRSQHGARVWIEG